MNEYIEKAQYDYLNLLEKYEYLLSEDKLAIEDVGMILDSVGKYWLPHKDCIEKEIDYSSSQETCMILSGAVYLDYADGDHYLYKALGKYHYLNDSILKLENIFRVPEKYLNIEKSTEVFKKAYRDELLVLRNTKKTFYYVPVNYIVQKRIIDRDDILKKSFWDTVSSLFDLDIRDDDSFNSKYSSFEAIEIALGPDKMKNLIYMDDTDFKLSLRSRIERYFSENQIDMSKLIEKKSDADLFLSATFSYIGQVLDILITATYFNLTPYIRFNITFHYFILIMNAFLSDITMKKMIEKTLLTYIFYHSVDKSKLIEIDFSDYCRRIEKYDYLKLIIEKLDEEKIDITKSGVKKSVKIMNTIFEGIIEH